MKQRRHTPEQVIRKLAEGEKLLAEGKTIEEVSGHLEISEQIRHLWRNQYGGMKADGRTRCTGLPHVRQAGDHAIGVDVAGHHRWPGIRG
jgi:transposase-like protein